MHNQYVRRAYYTIFGLLLRINYNHPRRKEQNKEAKKARAEKRAAKELVEKED